MTNTILVKPYTDNATIQSTGTNAAQPPVVISQLTIIFGKHIIDGLTIGGVEYLQQLVPSAERTFMVSLAFSTPYLISDLVLL